MINFLKNIQTKIYKHTFLKLFIIGLIVWLIIVGLINTYKKMPEGTNFISKSYITKSENIKFLYDLSFIKDGKKEHEQSIFDSILEHINTAEHYILIDMFLFNSQLGGADSSYRELSGEITKALINKKKENPEIQIDFISDPINIVYGGYVSKELEALKVNNINVIISNLSPLRDSNPLWSSVHRTFFNHFGNSNKVSWLKNPFGKDDKKVSLRSYLSLLNFKANHRKVFVSDFHNEMISIVASANPHDGSAAHSNTAIKISGDFWQTIWYSEQAVAKMSGGFLSSPPVFTNTSKKTIDGDTNISLELITEKKIKDSLLEAINNTKKDDQITMAIFYMSDRDIVKSLLSAADREVEVKIILDPNKDAFGYKKVGIPNRQVAGELTKKSNGKIQIRWYDTHGEQFHTKLIYIAHKNGPSIAILGSANYTKRNIDNYNLETNVSVVAHGSTIFMQDIYAYLKRIWENNDSNTYTTDYETYQDDSKLKYLVYRLQEATGLSSF